MRLDSIKRQENYKKYLAQNKGANKSLSDIGEKVKGKAQNIEDKAKEKIKDASNKLKEAGKNLLENKTSTLVNALGISKDIATSMGKSVGSLIVPDVDVNIQAQETQKNQETQEEQNEKEQKLNEKKSLDSEKKLKTNTDIKVNQKAGPRPINKPAVFFIKGLSLFSFGKDGLEEMSKAYDGAEVFEWDQTDEMIFEIKRRPKNQPIVLIGHSLGSDTALEIANELNSLEHKFRSIDLIISLDSVGFNNDIVPTNVRQNLNIISDGFTFLSDHPNIARDFNKTKVENILSEKSHMSLDNTNAIQAKVIETIDKALNL